MKKLKKLQSLRNQNIWYKCKQFLKWVFFLIIISFVFSSCESEKSVLKTELEKRTNPSIFLEKEDYISHLELNWIVKWNKETKVWPKIWWIISNLYFDIWDIVFKDVLLWEVLGEEVKTKTLTDSINLWNLYKQKRELESVLEKKIIIAKQNFEILNNQYEMSKNQNKSWLISKTESQKLEYTKIKEIEKKIIDTEIEFNKNIENLEKEIKNEKSLAEITIKESIHFLDMLLWITDNNKNKNDNFEQNLWTLKSEVLSIAKTDARFLFWLKEEVWINEKLKSAQVSLKSSYLLLQNSTSWANFSETDLETLKKQNLLNLNNIETKLKILEKLKNWLEALKIKKESSINNLKLVLNTSKQKEIYNIAQTEQGQLVLSSQEDIAKNQLIQAKNLIEQAELDKKNQLRAILTKIDLIKWNNNLAKIAVKNTQFWAPFDWIITKKEWEVWTTVSGGASIFTIVDISKYKVLTDVSNKFINKIKKWQKAIVKINWITYEWVVTKKYPIANLKTQKTNIEISIKWGIWNNIILDSYSEIILNIPVKWAFFVPKDFINYSLEGTYVMLKDKKKQYIETGEEIDWKIKIRWKWDMDNVEIYKR